MSTLSPLSTYPSITNQSISGHQSSKHIHSPANQKITYQSGQSIKHHLPGQSVSQKNHLPVRSVNQKSLTSPVSQKSLTSLVSQSKITSPVSQSKITY